MQTMQNTKAAVDFSLPNNVKNRKLRQIIRLLSSTMRNGPKGSLGLSDDAYLKGGRAAPNMSLK